LQYPITQTVFDIRFPDTPIHNSEQENLVDSTAGTEPDSPHVRRSDRVRRIPDYLKDYHHQVNFSNSAHNNVDFKNTLKTPYPISTVLSYHSLSEK